MDELPDEIIAEILDFLDWKDIVTVQRLSSKFLKLARDNSLWRYKCFEESPSAALTSRRITSLATLTGALGSLSISEPSDSSLAHEESRIRQHVSKRAQAATEWDLSHSTEKIDWYAEYIARHATLSAQWLAHDQTQSEEVRGIALLGDSGKAVGPLENGSFCIWDISLSRSGSRRLREVARAAPGTLYEDPAKPGGPSNGSSSLAFMGVECINADLCRNRAYIAVQDMLNEVDLTTMQLVSQHKSRSPEDLLRTVPGDPEESIAFLPNYSKTFREGGPLQPDLSNFAPASTPAYLGARPRQPRRSNLSAYARIEPGPLSILHYDSHEILIAGRFPSILCYDRRYFPRMQYAIHSGARLSTIITLPFPPRGAGSNSTANATLIAAGEYGGRGSLELYSLPHVKQDPRRNWGDYGFPSASAQRGAIDREHALNETFIEPDYPFSYKNRQAASTSKLLAVATQGTRIVLSDAEGGLKWVERDGIGLVRRWNVNTFEMDERGARVISEQVIRKIVPLDGGESSRGSKGDGDLLVWTGEKVGIVCTRPPAKKDGSQSESGSNTPEEQGVEYSRQMRRALERQADEARWMRRFRLNR